MDAARDILDDDPPVTVSEAARQLGLSKRTVQTDIADGAPVVRPGRRGGESALLRVGEYRDWRRGAIPVNRLMDSIGEALLDTLRRDAGNGQPAHVARRVFEHDAAVLYLAAYARIHRALTGEEPTTLPAPIRQLLRLAESEADSALLL